MDARELLGAELGAAMAGPGGPMEAAGLGERVHVTRRARRLSVTTVQAHSRINAGLLRDVEAGAVSPSAHAAAPG